MVHQYRAFQQLLHQGMGAQCCRRHPKFTMLASLGAGLPFRCSHEESCRIAVGPYVAIAGGVCMVGDTYSYYMRVACHQVQSPLHKSSPFPCEHWPKVLVACFRQLVSQKSEGLCRTQKSLISDSHRKFPCAHP